MYCFGEIMDTNNIRKLSRKELLELLIDQMKENEELKVKLQQKERELENIHIISAKAGSLAEASLELVNIFKKADEAAELYLNNLKYINENGEDS